MAKHHGMSNTAEYKAWVDMKIRCNNSNNPHYHNYGGRGIKVSDEFNDFRNFYAVLGDRPQGHSLDRIDNDGDYEAGNVKWSTKEEQDNNRRTNRRITYDGKTMTMTEWARSIGLSPKTLSTRIVDNGWTVEEALTTPKGAKRGSKEVAMEKVAC